MPSGVFDLFCIATGVGCVAVLGVGAGSWLALYCDPRRFERLVLLGTNFTVDRRAGVDIVRDRGSSINLYAFWFLFPFLFPCVLFSLHYCFVYFILFSLHSCCLFAGRLSS